MKNVIYIILICFVSISCRAQKIIETDSKDVLVFEWENDDVQLAKYYTKIYNEDNTYKATVETSANKEVFKDKNINIITQEWKDYGYSYFDKKYTFIQQKDTMNIYCKCGQFRNYYFRNLEFKKGNFDLNFDFGTQYNEQTKRYEMIRPSIILGSQIENSKDIQNILFKESYFFEEESSPKNLYFKDLKFYEINLKDTVRVKLIEIKSLNNR